MSIKRDKDLKLVMSIFGIISVILVFVMIIDFKKIDFIYFCGVLFFGLRYLIFSSK